MKNNDTEKYLWDGSGEKDKEIERLEKLLKQFKYQEKDLQLKEPKQWSVQIRFALVAATILLTLSTGLWLFVNKTNIAVLDIKNQTANSYNSKNTRIVKPTPIGEKQINEVTKKSEQLAKTEKSINSIDTLTIKAKYHHKIHHTPFKPKQDEIAMESKDNGEEAAKQLLLALQIASTKLNVAQKRVQENFYQ